MREPEVGDVVIYRDYEGEDRAAIVTRVFVGDEVKLRVFDYAGLPGNDSYRISRQWVVAPWECLTQPCGTWRFKGTVR